MQLLLFLALLLGLGPSYAAETSSQVAAPLTYDNQTALKFSESVVGQEVGDYTLLNRQGQPFKISSYRGKPLLVSFIYTSCTEVCPATTQYLGKAVKYMQTALGTDSFAVLTVGFNAPWDSPMTMRDYAKKQSVNLPNWEYASADVETMKNFTRNLGFSYEYSVAGFNHISMLTLIDQNGRIYSQVYGDTFELPALGEPLKKLVGNVQTQYPGWEGISNRIRLFCTVYDPKTRAYTTDYSFFMGMAISIVMIYYFAAWLIRAWRNAPKRTHTGGKK
ncbi:MAG: SCO family protein [Gallionellaceae bacterium]|nr:SCO family protein [Gallionellaceae bacterium]